MSTDQDLEFGQFAVRFGGVTEDQLQQAIATCQRDPGRPLGEVLVELGALSSDACQALQTLLTAQQIVQASPDSEDTPLEPMSASDEHDTVNQTVAPPMPDESERAIDSAYRFDRQALHAEGGLGKVYEAHDRQLNRTVALKEIKGCYADDTESRERFTKEAEITGRLEHPGIVPVYALGKYSDGRPYYAMRFIKGKSLRAAIAEYHTDPSMDEASRLLGMRDLLGRLIDVCDAVYYAHRRGIVHRDIKPSNIMLGEYGETLVVDWGLAKTLGRRELSASASTVPKEETLLPTSGSSVTETMAGKAVGSPAFMSPEQARGQPDAVGFAADVYGIGATMYAMLTSRPPVEGGSSAEILSKVREGQIEPPRNLVRSIPPPLESICLKALARDTSDRYRTVRALRSDLDSFLADEPVAAYKESMFEAGLRVTRRRRWLFPAIVVGMLGCFSVAGVVSAGKYARQALLTRTAHEKEREVQAAFREMAAAYRVIDPFDGNQANLESLEAECQRVQSRNIPEISKAMVYDSLVHQFRRFRHPQAAVRWARESWEISKRVLGIDDLRTLARQRDLAVILRMDQKYNAALELLEPLIAMSPEEIGEDLYYGSLNDLAAIHLKNGDAQTGISMSREVLDFRLRVLGERDPQTIRAQHALAQALSKTGENAEAITLLEEIVPRLDQVAGLTASERLTMRSSLALAHYRIRHYEDALAEYESLHPLYIDLLRRDHPHTLALRLSIASCQRNLGRFEDSIRNFREVIAETKAALGESHQYVPHAQLGLASALLASGDYQTAYNTALPPLERTIEQFGFRHENSHYGSETCAFALIALGEFESAEAIVTRWYEADAHSTPALHCSATHAMAQVTLGLRNFGSAKHLIDELDKLVKALNPPSLIEQAGLASLRGELHLSNREFSLAEAELLAAYELIVANRALLNPHQWQWSKQIKRRLVSLYDEWDRPEEAEKWRQE